MQVLSYTPQRHERFYSGGDRAFGWQAYNWTGIGKDSTGTYFCTLISPSFFISANHWHPANGATIRWYKTNDLTGAYVEGTVLSGQNIGTSDVWLGKMSAPVDASIARMAVYQGVANQTEAIREH